jgi:hypothetical protein
MYLSYWNSDSVGQLVVVDFDRYTSAWTQNYNICTDVIRIHSANRDGSVCTHRRHDVGL